MIGPVRRKAFEAAQQAYAAASEGRNLIADLADGFGISAVLDLDAALKLFREALAGTRTGKVRLPIDFVIDPSVDAAKKGA